VGRIDGTPREYAPINATGGSILRNIRKYFSCCALIAVFGIWELPGCAQPFAPFAAQQKEVSNTSSGDSSQTPDTPDTSAWKQEPMDLSGPGDSSGTGVKPAERVIAMNPTPIGPKSDDTRVETRQSFVDYHARYGKDFSQILPHNSNWPQPPAQNIEPATWALEKDGSLNLKILCELHLKNSVFGWTPCPTDMQVRMVFTPDGHAEADASPYDADVKSTDDVTPNVTFDSLKPGLGTVDLFVYKGDFSTANAYPLGSFELIMPQTLKMRIVAPLTRDIYRSAP